MGLQNLAKTELLNSLKGEAGFGNGAKRLRITGIVENSTTGIFIRNVTTADYEPNFRDLTYQNTTGSPSYNLQILADGTNITQRQFFITPASGQTVKITGVTVEDENNFAQGPWFQGTFGAGVSFNFPENGTFTLTGLTLTLSQEATMEVKVEATVKGIKTIYPKPVKEENKDGK